MVKIPFMQYLKNGKFCIYLNHTGMPLKFKKWRVKRFLGLHSFEVLEVAFVQNLFGLQVDRRTQGDPAMLSVLL